MPHEYEDDIARLYEKLEQLERELDRDKDDLRRAQWEIDDLKRMVESLERQLDSITRYR